MPYKNPEEHYTIVTVKLRRTEPTLVEALKERCKDKKITMPEYFRFAVREQLIRDGYMLESDK